MACGMPMVELITCSLCPAVCGSQLPMPLVKQRRGEREISSRNGKHAEHFSKKKSPFYLLPPCFLLLWFFFSLFFIIAEDSSSELLEVSPLVVNLDALGVSRSGFAMPKAQRHFRYKHPPHPYMLPQPRQRRVASGQNPQRPATELLPCHPPLCTAVEKGQCHACIYSFFF